MQLSIGVMWKLLLAVFCLQFFRSDFFQHKSRNPSRGIQKQLDERFSSWTASLLQLTPAERAETKTRPACDTVKHHLLGRCLLINRLSTDRKSLNSRRELSPFHFFAYTLVRRTLEICCLYLCRWLPLASLSGFVVSGVTLLLHQAAGSVRANGKNTSTHQVPKYITFAFLIFFLTFVLLAFVLVLFLRELTTGDLMLHTALVTVRGDSSFFLLRKIFVESKPAPTCTFLDFYSFYALREMLFDKGCLLKDATGHYDKFRLLIQVVTINGIVAIVLILQYILLLGICYVGVRVMFRSFKLFRKNAPAKIEKENQRSKSKMQFLEGYPIEAYCQHDVLTFTSKRILNKLKFPGKRAPKAEPEGPSKDEPQFPNLPFVPRQPPHRRPDPAPPSPTGTPGRSDSPLPRSGSDSALRPDQSAERRRRPPGRYVYYSDAATNVRFDTSDEEESD